MSLMPQTHYTIDALFFAQKLFYCPQSYALASPFNIALRKKLDYIRKTLRVREGLGIFVASTTGLPKYKGAESEPYKTKGY